MIRSDLRDFDLDAATAWEILARITPQIVIEEDRRDALDALAERCRTGWIPTPDEIPTGIRVRTLTSWTHAIDGIAFPESDEWYSPATKLMGRDAAGHGQSSGTILWIPADRSYAVCEDGFWWLEGAA